MKFCYNTSCTLPKRSQKSRSVLQDRSRFLGLFWKKRTIQVLPSLNNPKDLDLSYKTDLDFWDYFERKKTSSHNRRNTVLEKFPNKDYNNDIKVM